MWFYPTLTDFHEILADWDHLFLVKIPWMLGKSGWSALSVSELRENVSFSDFDRYLQENTIVFLCGRPPPGRSSAFRLEMVVILQYGLVLNSLRDAVPLSWSRLYLVWSENAKICGRGHSVPVRRGENAADPSRYSQWECCTSSICMSISIYICARGELVF
jgi:hypothetical protein